jgi:hypothetical protein
MSDLFSLELADGLMSGECPLCYAIAWHMRRWLDSFWREGRRDRRARQRFLAGGGFCRRHAWQLHELVADHSGVAIADIYGRLAQHDLTTLDELLNSGKRHGRAHRRLQREARCSACLEENDALERKGQFFLELLDAGLGRAHYERSRGLCFPHLMLLLEAAADDDGATRYLLADWRRRLEELRRRLDDFDRKRDHRYADERSDDDQRSWTDVIHQYVGAPDNCVGETR